MESVPIETLALEGLGDHLGVIRVERNYCNMDKTGDKLETSFW